MLKEKRERGRRRNLQKAILIGVMDCLAIVCALFAGLWIRFDFHIASIPTAFLGAYLRCIGPLCLICIAVFFCFGLYNSIWSYVSTAEVFRCIGAYAVLGAVTLGIYHFFGILLPRSSVLIAFVFSFVGTVSIRFSYRMMRIVKKILIHKNPRTQKNVMVIGAGDAGKNLVNEFINSGYIHDQVVCIIDDNPVKLHKKLLGVPIVGDRSDIPEAVEKYKVDKIVFAIPSASAATRKAILDICSSTGCKVQLLPGIFQLVNEEVSVSKLRDVDPQDLLGREPIRVNMDEIFAHISGKTVLVTGGGGSIGSELCRQIARSNPKKLIIFDVYENNAYSIQQELKRNCPELNLETLIGSVRNTNRINSVMKTYRPDIVFHAAAHKHVPLMEDSPNEAIKNNVIGTYKTATAAVTWGVKKFVLISTDKAVNPTNIMGASKRLCEMVVQMMDRRSPDTSFVAVRFGNVLGSNGSVIPLFKEQIAKGGPVTVTDKRIIRYFLTIPEAVSLVLQASYYAKGGEIFVLEMGEPVKIDDMARNLIRLSGYTPDVDIKVVYTGLRPGEKLYEELLMNEEGLQETDNKLIHIGKPIEMNDEWFLEKLSELNEASKMESDRIREIVAEVVPTYHYKKETADNTRQGACVG